MNSQPITLLPILIPIAASMLMMFIKTFKKRGPMLCLLLSSLSATFASSVLIAVLDPPGFTICRITENIVLYLEMDGLSRFFMLLMSLMWLVIGVYSAGYMKHENNELRYNVFYLLVLGTLMGLCLSGNVITMFFFFEAMTVLSVPIVLHKMDKEAIAAGKKYLYYSIGGAFTGLLGIFFAAHYCSTTDFIMGGSLDISAVAGNEGVLLAAVFLTILGFGMKAGLFPLHAWLPTAHPIAPSPASAALSGVITKSGVFCVIRFVFYIIGADFIRGTWVQYAWMGLALLTILMGSVMAYREPMMKKRLAYSSVSQLSYILLGLSLLDKNGFIGAMLHVIFHSVIKSALFMATGAIIMRTGRTNALDMRGVGKQMPLTLACFAIASLGLVGIPPTSGFLSKWYLAMGAMDTGAGFISWFAPAVLLLSALLTAGYLFKIVIDGFFPGTDFDHNSVQKCEAERSMTVPLLTLAAVTVVLGIFPDVVMNAISAIAEKLMLI